MLDAGDEEEKKENPLTWKSTIKRMTKENLDSEKSRYKKKGREKNRQDEKIKLLSERGPPTK